MIRVVYISLQVSCNVSDAPRRHMRSQRQSFDAEMGEKAPLPKASKRWDTSLITKLVVSDALGANQPASTRILEPVLLRQPVPMRMYQAQGVAVGESPGGGWLLGDGGGQTLSS